MTHEYQETKTEKGQELTGLTRERPRWRPRSKSGGAQPFTGSPVFQLRQQRAGPEQQHLALLASRSLMVQLKVAGARRHVWVGVRVG